MTVTPDAVEAAARALCPTYPPCRECLELADIALAAAAPLIAQQTLLAEQAATIERVRAAVDNNLSALDEIKVSSSTSLAKRILTDDILPALGSQRTEGQG